MLKLQLPLTRALNFGWLATFLVCLWAPIKIGAVSEAGANKKPASASGATLDEFIRLYATDHGGVARFYDLPWSEARFDRLEQLFNEWVLRLQAVDFDALNQAGRIDYLLLRNKLGAELARLSLERRRLTEMQALLPFRKPLQDMERARWRMQSVDSQACATTVTAFAEQMKKLRERIEKGKKSKSLDDSQGESNTESAVKQKQQASTDETPLKPSPMLAKRTAAAVGDLRGSLKAWFSFYDGYQPDFSWWLKKPYDEAAKALEDYAKYLREDAAGLKGKDDDPLVGDPIGAESLAQELAAEWLPYSAEELITIGEQEFAWCEARMKDTARQMGLGEDWKAALAKVKALYVPPGKQDELVAEQGRSAIKFVKDHDLATIPPLCEETWRLSMISPDGQKTLPFAAYGGQNMMVAYAKEEMKDDDKLMSMHGNNRHVT